MKKAIYLLLILLCPLLSWGQSASMSQRITVSFEKTSLEEALQFLSESYQLNFAYSPDKIPLNQEVNLELQNEPVADVLDTLFTKSKIVYARIGDQVVLKIDEKKNQTEIGVNENEKRLSGREIEYEYSEGVYRAEEMKSDSPIQKQAKVLANNRLPKKLPPKALIAGGHEFEIDYSELDFQGYINLKNYKIPIIEELKNIDIDIDLDISIADSISTHVGVVPSIEKRFGKNKETDNISTNLIWGKSQNIEGVQISGLLNSVERDMEGLQVALLGNIVEGNAIGSQVGGLFNYSANEFFGSQISGISNTAQTIVGAQLSFITNQAHEAFSGVQFAGIYNKAQNASGGTQLSLLHNKSTGKINTQIGLLNKAEKVKGLQFGLINMADTVKGAPIALLNLIKRGYNRLELAYDATLPLNVGLKLGARGFYNIFQASAFQDFQTWGIGYGFGTYAKFGKRVGMNFEIVALHLSEKDFLVKDWNLLGQFRTTLDFRLGRKFSLFVGPNFNLHYTEYYDTDNLTFKTNLTNNALFEETDLNNPKPYRIQTWIGFNAGLRF